MRLLPPAFAFLPALLPGFVAAAQTPTAPEPPAPKTHVYADLGLGIATRTFSAEMDARTAAALGTAFDPGTAATLTVAFLAVPARLPSVGFGADARVSSGSPAAGGDPGADFFFNDYDFGASARYYPLADFGAGLYVQGGIGQGQLTMKRAAETERDFVHQFAVGQSYTAGVGYGIRLRKTTIGLEAEYVYSSRSGTVDGVGEDVTFTNRQFGLAAEGTF